VSRVVLAGPVPPWRSGIADQTIRLARAMRGRGVEPEIVTFRRMYPRILYPGLSDRGPGEFPADAGKVLPLLDGTSPLSFRAAGREVGRHRPDAVVVPWWTVFFGPHVRLFLDAVARESPGTARLLLCHNLVDHEGAGWKRRVAASVFRRADRFAVQNARAREELLALVPGARVEVIPHPSEPRRVLPDRAGARARLGIAPGEVLFLFTGLLRPYKGWELLLEAFSRIPRDFPRARLVLAGEPWGEAKRLAEKSSSLDGVRLELRYLPEEERALWLDACDAVVCPYLHATGSGIAADALAHGRGVIGTRVDGLVEVVAEGESGILVPPGDVDALERALRRFLEEGLGEPLAAGAVLHRSRFSPDEHARSVLALAGC
jgi:glycosyltransferase involved in cell wall biosynthesis